MDNYHWQNLLKEQKVIHRLYDFCSVIPIRKVDNDKTFDFLHSFLSIVTEKKCDEKYLGRTEGRTDGQR
jgi:hypothetical protein